MSEDMKCVCGHSAREHGEMGCEHELSDDACPCILSGFSVFEAHAEGLTSQVAELTAALEQYQNPDNWLHSEYDGIDSWDWIGPGELGTPGPDLARAALSHAAKRP